jgi:hypothetical protein
MARDSSSVIRLTRFRGNLAQIAAIPRSQWLDSGPKRTLAPRNEFDPSRPKQENLSWPFHSEWSHVSQVRAWIADVVELQTGPVPPLRQSFARAVGLRGGVVVATPKVLTLERLRKWRTANLWP